MIASDSALPQPDSIKLLDLIGRWFTDFATRPIECLPFRTILPLSGFTIVHSLRIAYLYHSILNSQGVKVGRSKQDVSFLQSGLVCTTLVMSGTTMASILRGTPSSLFSEGSGELVTSYMLASAAMKWLHPFINQLPQLPLKSLCCFIDGFATAFGTLSLGLIPTLKDPSMQSSSGDPLTLPILLLPLLCGSGASLLVPVFGLFQPQFSFGHPGFLSEHLSVDFWGPWLISLCYGTIVDGRGWIFGGARQILKITNFLNADKQPIQAPWMRPDEAHVLCSLLLSTIYIFNEFGIQILNKANITSPPMHVSPQDNKNTTEKSEAILATGIEASAQLSRRKQAKNDL